MKANAEPACCCSDLYQLPLTRLLLGDSFHPGGLNLTRQLANSCSIGRNSQVLDLASGTGATAQLLTEHFGARVCAVDLGRQNLCSMPVHPRLRAVQADVTALPFAPASFDAVLCECALCTFAEPEQALAQARSVLRPLGYLGLSDMLLNAPLPDQLNSPLFDWLCVRRALSASDYQALLSAAGFRQIRMQQHSQQLLEMLSQVEQRLARLQDLGQLQQWLPDTLLPQLENLGLLAEFIRSGGLGYASWVARSQ